MIKKAEKSLEKFEDEPDEQKQDFNIDYDGLVKTFKFEDKDEDFNDDIDDKNDGESDLEVRTRIDDNGLDDDEDDDGSSTLLGSI